MSPLTSRLSILVRSTGRISLGCLTPRLGGVAFYIFFHQDTSEGNFVYDFRVLFCFLFILIIRDVYNLRDFNIFRCLYSLLLGKNYI